MPGSPLLSICIPTYNRAHWLRHSLAALAPQIARAGEKVELVVSDNCSSDDTPQVVEAMQALCPIRYHRNQTNIGGNPNFYLLVRELARGERVWLLGDDDLVREDGVERILRVLEEHPDLDYVYVNYTGWLVDEAPEQAISTRDFPLLPAGSLDLEDRSLPELAELIPADHTCFTAIYCSIFRLRDAREAYRMDVSSLPFSTLESVSPQAVWIAEHLLHKPAWYIGYPCVIVSSSTSWDRYLPYYLLELMPQLYDRIEQAGVPASVLDPHRRRLLRLSGLLLWRMLTRRETPLRRRFSLWRFIRRNIRYPEFWQLFLKFKRLLTRRLALRTGPG